MVVQQRWRALSAIDEGEHASSVVLVGRGGVGVSVAVTFALAMALLWACIGIDDAGVCAACALVAVAVQCRLQSVSPLRLR